MSSGLNECDQIALLIPVPLTVAAALLPDAYDMLPLQAIPQWVLSLQPVCKGDKGDPCWPLLFVAGRRQFEKQSTFLGCIPRANQIKCSEMQLMIPGVDASKDGRTPYTYVSRILTDEDASIRNSEKCTFTPSGASPFAETSAQTKLMTALRGTVKAAEVEYVDVPTSNQPEKQRELEQQLKQWLEWPILTGNGKKCTKITRRWQGSSESLNLAPISATCVFTEAVIPKNVAKPADNLRQTLPKLNGFRFKVHYDERADLAVAKS